MMDRDRELLDDRDGRLMEEFYLSREYDPKASRNADTVKAAIKFAMARAREEALEEAARKFVPLFSAAWTYCTNHLADEFEDPEFCGIDEKQHEAISAVFHSLDDTQDLIRSLKGGSNAG